jgi:hypothetical protein
MDILGNQRRRLVGRVVFSIVIGLFSLFVVIGGAELFQELFHHSTPLERTTLWEVLGSGLLVGLYFVIGQFFVASRKSRKLAARWPTMAAMAAPLLAMCLVSVAVERHTDWAFLGGIFVSGCVAIVVGAAAAGWVTLPAASLKSCGTTLLACAAVLFMVNLVVAAGVIPPTGADTFPKATPANAVPVLWGVVGLNLFLMVDLMWIGMRAGGGLRPSQGSLGFAGFLVFILALGLTPTVTFLQHGPAMRMAAVLGGLCAAAQFVVMILIGTIALRLPVERQSESAPTSMPM